MGRAGPTGAAAVYVGLLAVLEAVVTARRRDAAPGVVVTDPTLTVLSDLAEGAVGAACTASTTAVHVGLGAVLDAVVAGGAPALVFPTYTADTVIADGACCARTAALAVAAAVAVCLAPVLDAVVTGRLEALAGAAVTPSISAVIVQETR